jgi:23S rRNA (uracil1939-C5)-methyltransferase
MTIEKLVFGGEGLARHDGRTVFIPFAAPGDRVGVRIVEERRNFARGEIVEILAPGPARRAPRCRHFGVCGGCDLQHVAYEAQAEAKAGFVRESLRRLGGIDWPGEIPVRTGPEFGYRTRTQLQSSAGRVGYFRAGSHEVVAIGQCPVLVPELEALAVATRARDLDGPIHLAAGDAVAVVAAPGARVHRRIGGFDLEFGAAAFFQGNRFLAETLVREATSGVCGRLAVDLYAGSGLFTLALAPAFGEVLGIESDRPAAAQGMENAGLNGATNVRFVAADVAAWLARNAAARPDLVLLDPPRAGTGPLVANAIAALAPPAIHYVSCDPATLARDLRVLVGAGYEIRSVVAVDLFPQTHHVESVVRLARVVT